MRRVTDLGLTELVKQRDVVAFVSTGSELETRVELQLDRLILRGNTELVELRQSDILDPEGTCLSFCIFPRIMIWRNGSCVDDIVGFEAIAAWTAEGR